MATKPKNNDKNPARDSCQTPDYALQPLLPYLLNMKSACQIIWEPAAGEGLLVAALEVTGFAVRSGDVLTGQNYFADDSLPACWDAMVTNPPFSQKYKWLERAYQFQKPFALLMPADTLFAATAQELFKAFGYGMLLPDKRIDFKMPNTGWAGTAQFTSAWFTWGLGVKQGVNFVELNKPRKNAPIQRPEAQLSLFDL